jgi:orotate phosphoribosyltransferase
MTMPKKRFDAPAAPREQAFLRLFVREGALLTGHFLLSSGLHSGQYVQCARVLRKPSIAARLAKALAALLKKRGAGVEIVAAPAVGGIVLGHELARTLKAESIFAERKEGRMRFRRGFSVPRGARVLVAEDVVTTGKSTREVIQAVRAQGGRVVGVAALVRRGTSSLETRGRIPFHALISLRLPACEPARCPLCREGVPLTSPGSKRLR